MIDPVVEAPCKGQFGIGLDFDEMTSDGAVKPREIPSDRSIHLHTASEGAIDSKRASRKPPLLDSV